MAPPSAARSLSLVEADEDDAPADPGWDDAWDRELNRRIADVREGRVQCLTLEETFAHVDARLAEVNRARGSARR